MSPPAVAGVFAQRGTGRPPAGSALARQSRPTWQNRDDAAPDLAAAAQPRLTLGVHMSKRGRKRKSRKKNGANHGNRPNA